MSFAVHLAMRPPSPGTPHRCPDGPRETGPVLARRMVVLAAVATVLLLTGAGVPRSQATSDPPLSVDRASVLTALHCPASFSRPKAPVLLVHGTGSTAEESWTHTFAKTLPLDGHDACTVDLPVRA